MGERTDLDDGDLFLPDNMAYLERSLAAARARYGERFLAAYEQANDGYGDPAVHAIMHGVLRDDDPGEALMKHFSKVQ